MPPTRLQKRWSRALRTGGALLLLLGTVALADSLLGAARAPAARYAGAAFVAAGAAAFYVGRRWS